MKTLSTTLTFASVVLGLLEPVTAFATETDSLLLWNNEIATYATPFRTEPLVEATVEATQGVGIPGLLTSQTSSMELADIFDGSVLDGSVLAQGLTPPSRDVRPDTLPSPEEALPERLPSPEELIESSPDNQTVPPGVQDIPGTIEVKRYEVVGSTVFKPEELEAVTRDFVGTEVSFTQLLQARSAITQFYVDNGYVNSGAFLPEQTLQDGVVKIQVIEGTLAEINITGLRRLTPRYVRERVEVAAGTPLNVPDLLEGLRLLQLDPLIENISAELSAGIRPGESILDIEIIQATTFGVQALLDNGRVPSVGSTRRQLVLSESTLFGQGDSLSVRYSNTLASNAFDVDYLFPLNARNGTFRFFYSHSQSEVIEDPFDILEIRSASNTFEFTVRQPIIRTTTQEFATSLTFTNRATETSLEIGDERIGFPLSPGASDSGDTTLSVLRFAQEWTTRSPNQVIGLRSQFNFGTNFFGATRNAESTGLPDGSFFSWQGQGQWVRQFAPDTLLVVRTNLQLADQPLVSLEQVGLGGFNNVRGYRQDRLLTDNGFFGSIEARIPIFRIPQIDSVAQVTPFFDYGVAWNSDDSLDPDPGQLASLGLGLRWEFANRITARLDVGFPLINDDRTEDTLQERGILFSITTDAVR